jgi:GT2 family glycosyltransferase
MKTAIVIPNWNGAEVIGDCLRSLHKQTLPADIIVVDNGSSDGSIELIERDFPLVKLIKLAHNTGFTGGVNRGLAHALKQDYEAVALFNNDAVADSHWLERLAGVMQEHPGAGVVTGKLMLNDRQHIDSTGECYSIWGLPFPRGRGQADKGQYDKPQAVFGATGGASLYRTSTLRLIGTFDNKYFAYLEDVDLSWRARLAGWEVYYQPEAVAYHKVGTTSAKLGNFRRYHFIKNFHLTYLKDMPGWLFWLYLPLAFLTSLRLFAGCVLRGQPWTFIKAYAVAVWLIPHCLRGRYKIQHRRQVPLRVINSMLYFGWPPKPPKT